MTTQNTQYRRQRTRPYLAMNDQEDKPITAVRIPSQLRYSGLSAWLGHQPSLASVRLGRRSGRSRAFQTLGTPAQFYRCAVLVPGASTPQLPIELSYCISVDSETNQNTTILSHSRVPSPQLKERIKPRSALCT